MIKRHGIIYASTKEYLLLRAGYRTSDGGGGNAVQRELPFIKALFCFKIHGIRRSFKESPKIFRIKNIISEKRH